MKIIAAVVCGILTFIGSFLPIFIRAAKWTERAESLAGGVFLGAGFAHLLSDSFKDIARGSPHSSYPISGAIAVSVFVLLTCTDIFSYTEQDARMNAINNDGDLESELNDVDNEGNTKEGKDCENPKLDEKEVEPRPDIEEECTLRPDTEHLSGDTQTKAIRDLFGKKTQCLRVPTLSLYIIMDIHSVIEGIALGILSEWKSVIALFVAVAGHKPVEAFALGLIVIGDKPTKWMYWSMLFLYASLSPAGIIIAMYLKEMSSDTVLGCIAAVSAGTFMFVGCNEWANMFLNKSIWAFSEKVWHLGMFSFGVLWMLLIAIIE